MCAATNLKSEEQSQDSPANRTGATNKVSSRKAEANRKNAQKSTGPSTEKGLKQVVKNLPAPAATRLLGLTEARTLKLEPGGAEALYRELTAVFEPALPPLVALHFQDLARLQLELQALERIRDAQLEHRAQQISLKVRRLYREMDRQLGVPPKDLFETGLCNIADSPAKFKMQVDALTVLKGQLERGEFEDIGPALRQLYSNALSPGYERAQLICIDCRRLMDPASEALSESDLKILLRLVEREIEDAMEGYALELDERTKTAAARLAELAPTTEDNRLSVQIDRLRRAIDRNKRLLPKMLEAAYRTDLRPATGSDKAQASEGAVEKKDTIPKPRGPLESTDKSGSGSRQSQEAI